MPHCTQILKIYKAAPRWSPLRQRGLTKFSVCTSSSDKKKGIPHYFSSAFYFQRCLLVQSFRKYLPKQFVRVFVNITPPRYENNHFLFANLPDTYWSMRIYECRSCHPIKTHFGSLGLCHIKINVSSWETTLYEIIPACFWHWFPWPPLPKLFFQNLRTTWSHPYMSWVKSSSPKIGIPKMSFPVAMKNN